MELDMDRKLIEHEAQYDSVGQDTKIDQKDLVREERGDKRRVLPVSLQRDWK
jgi:hypothetical protein